MASRPAKTVFDGVDLSTRGDGATLAAHHQDFVVRYVSPDTQNHPHKRITLAEQNDYFAHDISVCYVWETTTSEATSGRAAGQRDAIDAATYVTSLGAPAGQPIYFAVDEDVPGSAIDPYFRGICDKIGVARSGAYGSLRVIRYLFDQRLITYGWQTYAWSAGQLEARAQAYQYLNDQMMGGLNVDLDAAFTLDYGQWDGSDMARNITDDDVAAIVTALSNQRVDAGAVAPPTGDQITRIQAERNNYYRLNGLANTFWPMVLTADGQHGKLVDIMAQSQANGSGISEIKATLAAWTGGAAAAGVDLEQLAKIYDAAAAAARAQIPPAPVTP